MEPYGELREYEPIHPRGPSLREFLRRLWAPIAAVVGILLKFGWLGLKFASIFIAIGGYALLWGWRFGVGFVALIFIHEMGHWLEARRQGLHPSWPTFIPFLGAYVTIKDAHLNPWRNSLVALAGPFLGGIGAAVFWGIGEANGSRLMQALGYAGFLINLINLVPVGFLDGGVTWRSARFLRLGGGREKAQVVYVLYFAIAAALALGMYVAHVQQTRL
jgi:membrane-associated protease RseP (regulator of RpoE activity)